MVESPKKMRQVYLNAKVAVIGGIIDSEYNWRNKNF